MKNVIWNKPVNLDVLTEELFEAFPEWLRPDPLGRGWMVTDAIMTPEGVTFPDETSEKEVQKVVDKHDKTKDSKNQGKDKERKANLSTAKEKLRALGLSDKEIDALTGEK